MNLILRALFIPAFLCGNVVFASGSDFKSDYSAGFKDSLDFSQSSTHFSSRSSSGYSLIFSTSTSRESQESWYAVADETSDNKILVSLISYPGNKKVYMTDAELKATRAMAHSMKEYLYRYTRMFNGYKDSYDYLEICKEFLEQSTSLPDVYEDGKEVKHPFRSLFVGYKKEWSMNVTKFQNARGSDFLEGEYIWECLCRDFLRSNPVILAVTFDD